MNRLETVDVIAAFAAFATLTAPALAQQAPAKRAEGRYFVELAEVMLSTKDFDILFAQDDPLGPRAGAPAVDVVAATPRNHLEAPKVTIGLNRPSGKSAFSMSHHDFDMGSQHVPVAFDREGVVATSHLLPPGVVFQRQAQVSTARAGNGLDDDFVPNFGTDWAYRLQIGHQQTDFTYERNVFESERLRLRWLGGLRYARLEQDFAHAMSFSTEYGSASRTSPVVREVRDFFFVIGSISTRGLGPKIGLDGRWLLDEKKKWSIEARADLAYVPESTTANYQVNMADNSTEFFFLTFTDPEGNTTTVAQISGEQPVIPGLPTEALRTYLRPFAATLTQGDFTEAFVVANGRLGFRYQANRMFGVGLDLWQSRWINVLSNAQMFAQINREATFDYIRATPGAGGVPNPDPQLQDDEAIVHLPRLSGREDFVFDGINLNLSFQF